MYQKRSSSWMKHIDFILLDLAAMAVSFYIGYIIRHGMHPFWDHAIYLSMFVVLLLLDLCVAFCRDTYSGIIRRGYLEEWKDSVLHCLITCGLLLLYFFLLQRSQAYSRMTILVFALLWCLLAYVLRCLRKHQIRVRMMKNPATEQMLILTDSEHAEACVLEMSGEIYRGYQVVGVVLCGEMGEDLPSGEIVENTEGRKQRKRQENPISNDWQEDPVRDRNRDLSGAIEAFREAAAGKESGIAEQIAPIKESEITEQTVVAKGSDTIGQEISCQKLVDADTNNKIGRIGDEPVVAGMEDLEEYLLSHVVDSVFIEAEMPREKREELIARLVRAGVTVHNNLAHVPHGLTHQAVERIGNYTVFTTGMHIATRRQIFLKRFMDITGGICGSILALFAMFLFGPLIYIQSPGPIFFTQTRVGKNGRRFKIYKFRSMYMDAEQRKAELMKRNEMDGLMFKMKEDPRIIPIGHFLRKFSIDELPQFFNVIWGDMSLVGTRPPTMDEFEQYQLHHRGRLNSKPGITGLWQVSGRNEITDFEEVVRLDTMYIMNWSVSEDIRILWKTVRQVVKGEGGV